MKVQLEIQRCAFVLGKRSIDDLNEKEIVPNPIVRRRLTRSAKILLFLANKVDFGNGKIIFATEFGECAVTSEIINSIQNKDTVSPTAFQNSVHNTAASYLSIQTGNKNEIITVSDFGLSSQSALKVGAIKALSGEETLIACVDSLDFRQIDEMNSCGLEFLECGSALVVKATNKNPDIELKRKKYKGCLEGHHLLLELCEQFELGKSVFEVEI